MLERCVFLLGICVLSSACATGGPQEGALANETSQSSEGAEQETEQETRLGAADATDSHDDDSSGVGDDAAEVPSQSEGSATSAERDAVVGSALEEDSVIGSLAPEQIRNVVTSNLDQIRYCYQRELMRNPNLHGRLVVRFIIDASGHVPNAVRYSSTLSQEPAGEDQSGASSDDDNGASAVESCVLSAVRRWVFPEPSGGGVVVVNYPFSFSPGEDSGTPGDELEAADSEAAE